MHRITGYGCGLVEITGGEPLIQEDTPFLVSNLIKAGYQVLVETNGSMDISQLDPECIKIMDIKCPSSNESHSLLASNLTYLGDKDQVKFVISDETDYRYAKGMMPMIPGKIPGSHLLFSPVHGKLSPDTLAQWILLDHLEVRLHLQLHKMIWPNIERGV
jgi:7-carboxy-7-deazaguanine synthase